MKIQEYYYMKWLFYEIVGNSSTYSLLSPEDLDDCFSDTVFEAFKKWNYNKVNYFKKLVNWRLIDLYNKNKEHEEYSFIDWIKNERCYDFNYKDWKDIRFVLGQILKEEELEMLLQNYIDELSLEEVAVNFKISRSTIKRRFSEIKNKIREHKFMFEWIIF